MKRHAATLLLVALAAALGLWLWLDRGHVTDGERKRRENSVFVAWRGEELTAVTIVHEGETIVLGRDGKAPWRMTSPRAERVDAAAVERLLTTLEFATVARKVTEGAGLGLESPRATGSLTMGGLVVAFALGGPSPRPEGSSYLRVGDGAPIVVSKELAELLLTPSDVYRDRTVVPYLATELAKVEVVHPGGGFALARHDERSFTIAATGVLASRAAVERMWASLASMRAESFPKDADVDRLTAHPVLTLILTPKDDEQGVAELVIGEACPGYPADVVVLRRRPSRVAACAPKDVVGALLVSDAALAERRLFTLRMDEIEELRLERVAASGAPVDAGGAAGLGANAGRASPGSAGAPPAIELARKGVGFHQREPVDRDLTAEEADAATDLLTRLADSDGESASRGPGPFAAVARARLRAGEHEEAVEVGAPDAAGRVVVRRVADDARLAIGPAVARRLAPRETSLRPRRVVAGETRRATRVLLRCGVDQELVDRGEGFRLVAPAGYETDGAITQLVDAVLRGHLDAWVADADDGTFGFTPAGCHVVLAFEDGNAPLTVWLGDEGEGGVYGRVEGRPGVFVAPRAVRELAGRIYVSRGSLRVAAERVERVRVTFAGKAVTERTPEALREAVGGLTAERVDSLGKKGFSSPAELVVEIAVAEGGPPRRIQCAPQSAASASPPGSSHGPPSVAGERLCASSGVDALFVLSAATLAPLLPPMDAGAAEAGVARDGATR